MAHWTPNSAEEWSLWQDACIQTNRRHLIPEDIRIRNWPEGFPEGPSWIPLAKDHPFAGSEFCWRCVAEAQDFPCCEAVPHRRARHVICWAPAEGDEAPVHAEQDTSPAEDRAQSDQRPEVTDTGNIFWPPPGWAQPNVPVHEPPWVIGEDGRHRYAKPEDAQPHPLAPWWTVADFKPEDLRFERHPQPPEPWQGFPSWTDDAPAAEPVQADLAQREAQHDTQPVQAHQAEDEDRQSGTDEAP